MSMTVVEGKFMLRNGMVWKRWEEGRTESGYGIRGYRSSAQLRFPSLIPNHPSLVLHNFTNEAIAVVTETGVGN